MTYYTVCANCNKEIRDDTDHYDGDDAIKCDDCEGWYHRRCAKLDEEEFERHSKDESLSFVCAKCSDEGKISIIHI